MKRFLKFISPVIIGALLFGVIPPTGTSAQPQVNKAYAKSDQSTVIVKLKAEAKADLVNGAFVGANSQSVDQLNSLLATKKATKKQPLLPASKQTFKQDRQQLETPLPANRGDLDNYYTITLTSDQKADDVAKALKALDAVETAYAKPLPTPPPATPDFTAYQHFLKPAPLGMGVNATIGGSPMGKPYPGSNGNKVRLADLEFSWNVNHEDIPRLRLPNALWNAGTPVDPFSDDNHGTAVAGIIAAARNGSGVDGTVPGVNFHMVNTNSAEYGWSVASSIYLAANKMTKGDVILLEQQAWAPDYEGYAPIEIYQDVYDAIVYATAKGIHVVEPSGNGRFAGEGYDLSDPMFFDAFTTGRPNSGAIMVGAGAMGCTYEPANTRMTFSNYGTRLDVRGHGDCVGTTGYGDLQFEGGLNYWYTGAFNGTSSASATIAGVVAEFSSSYEQINGTILGTNQLRTALKTGGTPQDTSVNPGHIGVLPNMAAVMPLTDITKPAAPTQLIGKSVAPNKITLNWKAATDNLGYVRYHVYRNNSKIATVAGTTYTDTSIRAKVDYTYKIVAVDASGNVSPPSNSVIVRNK